MPAISTAWKTDKGPRPANEDSCVILTRDDLAGAADGLLVVADGMGGRASGATASGLAVEAVRRTCTSAMQAGDSADLGGLLSRSLVAANSAVLREAGTRPELQGMGTTCVAAAVKEGRLFMAHVGDSRGYLLRDGRLLRLTEDHSIVAEKVRSGEMTEDQARRSRFRNVITRAIGLDEEMEPEVSSTDLRPGDVILLCSDGLTGPVREPEIADIVGSSATAEEACDRLVKTALKNGGSDNVTVAIAAYRSAETSPNPSLARRGGTSAPLLAKEGLGEVSGVETHARGEGIGRKIARILVPGLLGIIIGTSLGLYAEKIPVLKKFLHEQKPVVARAPEPDLTSLTYGIPASLLYTPVQGCVLSLHRGHLYVADTKGRLTKVDTTGRVIADFAADHLFEQQAKSQSSMCALDRQGNLYVSDPANKCIRKYAADGALLATIGEKQLIGPEALAIDRNGDIYVVDGGRLKVIHPKSADTTPDAEQPDGNTPSSPE